MKPEIKGPDFQLIGGKILTSSDLDAMNEAEVRSRKIPLASEQQSHKSKFFAVGTKHRIHVQLCHYPCSNPKDGMFIFLEKECGRPGYTYFEPINHKLHSVRDRDSLDKLFWTFSQNDADLYANELSPKSKF